MPSLTAQNSSIYPGWAHVVAFQRLLYSTCRRDGLIIWMFLTHLLHVQVLLRVEPFWGCGEPLEGPGEAQNQQRNQSCCFVHPEGWDTEVQAEILFLLPSFQKRGRGQWPLEDKQEKEQSLLVWEHKSIPDITTVQCLQKKKKTVCFVLTCTNTAGLIRNNGWNYEVSGLRL